MNINGKDFFEVNARFLVHFDGMESMDEKTVLIKIVDLIHDGAELNGVDSRRIIIEKADD